MAEVGLGRHAIFVLTGKNSDGSQTDDVPTRVTGRPCAEPSSGPLAAEWRPSVAAFFAAFAEPYGFAFAVAEVEQFGPPHAPKNCMLWQRQKNYIPIWPCRRRRKFLIRIIKYTS